MDTSGPPDTQRTKKEPEEGWSMGLSLRKLSPRTFLLWFPQDIEHACFCATTSRKKKVLFTNHQPADLIELTQIRTWG